MASLCARPVPCRCRRCCLRDDIDLILGHAWTAEALARGVYLHPCHNMFLCAALTDQDMRTSLERTDDAFRALRRRCGDTRAAGHNMQQGARV